MFTFKMQDNNGVDLRHIGLQLQSQVNVVLSLFLCCSAQIKCSLINLNFVSHWSGATRSYWQHSFHSGLDLVRHLVNKRLLGLLKQNLVWKEAVLFNLDYFYYHWEDCSTQLRLKWWPLVHRLYTWRNISTKTLC